jgi:iron complex outermembrane receptor protein
MKNLLLLSASLSTLAIAAPALAQDGGQEADTITVIGSRVAGRTALQSNVPVDVIQASELALTPSFDMKDAMKAVSPSFDAERNQISDGATYMRATRLRGLNGGETIVLLNGKRVHRNAVLIGEGYQAADLGSFSVNSLKSVSVLRDGAAAQYGADAVAGVINLTLDDSEGISGMAQYSKYYAGDGAAYTIASKVGVSLADRGFLTVTASYSHANPTHRGTGHLMMQDHIDNKFPGWQDLQDRFDDDRKIGISETTNFNVTWNGAMEVGENSEIYFFGNFHNKNLDEFFNYRPAVPAGYQASLANGQTQGASSAFDYTGETMASMDSNLGQKAAQRFYYLASDGPLAATDTYGVGVGGVIPGYTNADGSSLLYVGCTPSATYQCPTDGSAFEPRNLKDKNNGFTPDFLIYGQDVAAYAGIRGDFDNGIGYDLSGSVGRNRINYFDNDTINGSLGAPLAADGQSINYEAQQTDFYAGSLVNIERSVGLDLTYEVETDAVESLNIAAGAEYRSEQYYNVMGEKSSWQTGPLVDLGIGSNGFQGYDPGQKFDSSRHNTALYIDVDTQVTEDLNIAVAARYEDFSDFGDNFSWKIAGRWQIAEDILAIRGAASTGFHAPSIGQINQINAGTGFDQGNQTYSARFPASHPAGVILGAVPLTPEQARNLSAGFILTPGDNTNITVDVFQISLANRIRTSKQFKRTDYPSLFKQIEDLGTVNGAADFTQVNFFTNSMDTRTRGVEVVATHNIDLDESSLKLVLAYAHLNTKVTKFDANTTSVRTVYNQEHDVPPHKLTFTGTWNMDALTITGRARWNATRSADRGFDATTNLPNGGNDTNRRIDTNPGKVFFDLSVNYDIDDQFSVTVGADNILNTYPAVQYDLVQWSNGNGMPYLANPGFDFQGGSYYAKVSANF